MKTAVKSRNPAGDETFSQNARMGQSWSIAIGGWLAYPDTGFFESGSGSLAADVWPYANICELTCEQEEGGINRAYQLRTDGGSVLSLHQC